MLKGRAWMIPLLIHVPLLCLVMHHASEDTVVIGSPRGPWWVNICSIAFGKAGVSRVMKNPTLLLPQYSSLSSSSAYPTTSKMCGLFADSFVLFPWDTFRAEKAHFLQWTETGRSVQKDQELLKWLIQNSKESSQTSSRAHSKRLFFFFFWLLRYLLGHSLILQTVGRPLLY